MTIAVEHGQDTDFAAQLQQPEHVRLPEPRQLATVGDAVGSVLDAAVAKDDE